LHGTDESCPPLSSLPPVAPLHAMTGGSAADSPSTPSATFISAPASRAFQRATASNTLLPCEKLAASTAIGYHATYPTPRTAANEVAIWSQSEFLAFASGVL